MFFPKPEYVGMSWFNWFCLTKLGHDMQVDGVDSSTMIYKLSLVNKKRAS